MNWQPIETAPKSGAWVLLKGGETDEQWDDEESEAHAMRPVVARWSPDLQCWVFAFWDSDWRCSYEAPTHWAELI